jgi:iron complex transport system permease protein
LRFCAGGDPLTLAPGGALSGGAFLGGAHPAPRPAPDSEIPLGVITGAVGSPFFFWLLLRPGSQG